MSAYTQFSSGGIKSIQRGVISVGTTGTGTATVTTVDTTKTELRFLGCGLTAVGDFPILVLTNATTVTATRQTTGVTTQVSWELTERY